MRNQPPEKISVLHAYLIGESNEGKTENFEVWSRQMHEPNSEKTNFEGDQLRGIPVSRFSRSSTFNRAFSLILIKYPIFL